MDNPTSNNSAQVKNSDQDTVNITNNTNTNDINTAVNSVEENLNLINEGTQEALRKVAGIVEKSLEKSVQHLEGLADDATEEERLEAQKDVTDLEDSHKKIKDVIETDAKGNDEEKVLFSLSMNLDQNGVPKDQAILKWGNLVDTRVTSSNAYARVVNTLAKSPHLAGTKDELLEGYMDAAAGFEAKTENAKKAKALVEKSFEQEAKGVSWQERKERFANGFSKWVKGVQENLVSFRHSIPGKILAGTFKFTVGVAAIPVGLSLMVLKGAWWVTKLPFMIPYKTAKAFIDLGDRQIEKAMTSGPLRSVRESFTRNLHSEEQNQDLPYAEYQGQKSPVTPVEAQNLQKSLQELRERQASTVSVKPIVNFGDTAAEAAENRARKEAAENRARNEAAQATTNGAPPPSPPPLPTEARTKVQP